ncbi:MAG: YggU family protein [Thermoplasmata archaeon]|nr:MAG: YggU family protein [Thermoplasmata archaeon]
MKEFDFKHLSKCINEQDDGILIDIEVKPGAKTSGIEGVDKWRDCVLVRLKERAEKGKANKELIGLLPSMLKLPSSDFIMVKGQRSRRKIIKILGLNHKELARRFKAIH